MKDLIAALLILNDVLNKPDSKYPTACEHDVLYVCDVDFNLVTIDMIHQLYKLGFIPGSDEDGSELYNENGEYIGDIDWESINEKTWDSLKDELTNCFRSYRFGCC